MSLAPHLLVAGTLQDLAPGEDVPIGTATLHHLRRVLRLSDGAALSVTDGEGRSADAVLAGDGARLAGTVRSVPSPGPRLVLAQALSKGRRADDAVRAACELGAGRIVPVVAARTQGRPDARAAEAIVERWRAIAVAALEQSRGVHLATVEAPVTTDALVVAPAGDDALRLLAVPGAEGLPDVLAQQAPGTAGRASEVVVAIGPEGGWSPEEVAGAMAAGWLAVGLGPTVLRTEHAGPVAVAVLAAVSGRWRADQLEHRPEHHPEHHPEHRPEHAQEGRAPGERTGTLATLPSEVRPSRSSDAL